jgi:lysozyme
MVEKYRKVSAIGIALIERFEGFSPNVYKCGGGYDTIGIGHLVKSGEDWSQGITKDQAREVLAKDLLSAERAVLRLTRVPLSDGQFDALVSFVFNLGSGCYQRSTLRKKVNREEHLDAANTFWMYRRAKGKILKGLVLRREAERELYLS